MRVISRDLSRVGENFSVSLVGCGNITSTYKLVSICTIEGFWHILYFCFLILYKLTEFAINVQSGKRNWAGTSLPKDLQIHTRFVQTNVHPNKKCIPDLLNVLSFQPFLGHFGSRASEFHLPLVPPWPMAPIECVRQSLPLSHAFGVRRSRLGGQRWRKQWPESPGDEGGMWRDHPPGIHIISIQWVFYKCLMMLYLYI